jgi:hypothetical protein
MIGLYQRRCPEARDDAEHYQALNAYADKRLDKCLIVFGVVAGLRTAALIKPNHPTDRLLFTFDAFAHVDKPANPT